MKRATTAILALVGTLFACCGGVRASEQAQPKQIIVLGVGIGDFKLGMSKDEVLRRLGEPKSIYRGKTMFTLENLPTTWYRLHYGHIEFEVNDNAVQMIKIQTPSYKFANGLGVHDSEDKIRQAFGKNFDRRRNVLVYEDRGVSFEIDEKERMVFEISVTRAKPKGDQAKPKVYDRDFKAYMNVRGRDLRDCDLRRAGDILDTLSLRKTLS